MRSRRYGRERARRRVDDGRFRLHPGWRHRVPEGVVIVRDQALALARVAELVDREDWRADKRTGWSGMLRALVCGMDWESGVIAGTTRAHLAAATGLGLRTATSLLAWAQDVGLLVCVEAGATAEFLGTTHNRAPAYVLVVPQGWAPPPPHQPALVASREASVKALFGAGVDASCHPPASCVDQKNPWKKRGQERLNHQTQIAEWPLWDAPRTPTDRARATTTLLERVGLTGKVPRHRALGLLTRWWRDEGACVAGLLYALDHHPDRPQQPRGDALRAARDPLAVLGHRLTPWRGRLAQLPAPVCAVDPDVRAARRRVLARRLDRKEHAPDRVHVPTSSPAARAAALEALRWSLNRSHSAT